MRCTGPLAMSAVVLPSRVDRLDVGALRHQVLNHLDVAARRRVVQRGVAFVIDGVDVGVQLLDQVLDRRPACRPARSDASWRRSLRRSRRRRRPAAASRRARRPPPAAAPTRRPRRGRCRRRAGGRRSAWCGCSDRRRTRPASSSRRRRWRRRRARTASRRFRRRRTDRSCSPSTRPSCSGATFGSAPLSSSAFIRSR